MCKNGEKCIVGYCRRYTSDLTFLDTLDDIQDIIDEYEIEKYDVELFCYCPNCGMAMNHMKYKYKDIDDNVNIGNIMFGKYGE